MKRSFVNIIQIWRTELKEIMHDKGILIFIIFVPLCYPLLYSFVYTNEVVRDVPFAVIDDCNNARWMPLPMPGWWLAATEQTKPTSY